MARRATVRFVCRTYDSCPAQKIVTALLKTCHFDLGGWNPGLKLGYPGLFRDYTSKTEECYCKLFGLRRNGSVHLSDA
jgi:hypothetical protein